MLKMRRFWQLPPENNFYLIRVITTTHLKFSKRWYLIPLLLLFTQVAYSQAPVANFTSNTVSGCAALVVTFTDQSSNNPTGWNWDFGNGTLSQVRNPTVIFNQPGVYSVTLVVTNANGTHGITKTNYITVNPSPSVGFTASTILGCTPVDIQFTDNTNPNGGTITSWLWNFGDGTTSTEQNPSKLYTTPGFYTVSLRVTSGNGCVRAASKGNYIRIVSGITPEFSNSTPVTCRPPYAVNFKNLTSGPGTLTYQWNLGNSTSSTQTNPATIYDAPGTYNVTLTATSQYGCSGTITKPVTIVGPVTTFDAPDTVCLNAPVNFQNTSSPAPVSSVWTFGNGRGSTLLSDTASFSVAGDHFVKVVNTYNTCIDSIIKPIHVRNNPVVDFTAPNVISCKAPHTVNFQDNSPVATGWQWDFGDGGTSNQQNPDYTYNDTGHYAVTLTITDNKGCTDSITKNSFTQIVKPYVQITNVPRGGCIPYSYIPNHSDSAIDGIASWLWDFGHNGATSTAHTPPPHLYTDSGTYTVKLIITTNGGCVDSSVVQRAIRTGPPPQVNFTFNTNDGCTSTMFNFTDLSVSADQWLWSFGDGTTSIEQNPLHQFIDTGYFQVSLTAYNNGCAQTFIHPQLIHIKPPLPVFTSLINCSNQLAVTFVNESKVDPAYGPISYLWNFGDPANSTSTQLDPVFTYPALGTYIVSLTVTNGSCAAVFAEEIKLVGETADFAVSKANVCKNEFFTVSAINSNPQNIDFYTWFVNGIPISDDERSISLRFPNPGVYDIGLRITDINGCSNMRSIAGAVTVTGPTANFTASSRGGCYNSTIAFSDLSTTTSGDIASWAFNFGDGQSQTFTTPPFTHLYSDTGVFAVTLTVRDNNSCINTYRLPHAITITKPVATFKANRTTICPEVDIQFTDTSKGKGLTHNWDFGDGSTSTAQNPLHQYAGSDSMYTVKLRVIDIVACSDSITKTNYITVRTPKPDFEVKDSSTICPPIETTFTFRGQDYESFYWDFGDGSTSTLLNPTHFYNTFGQYTATLHLTGYGGCQASTSSTINLYDPRNTTTLDYSPLTACNELMVDFNITTPPSTSFTLFFGDGTTDTTQVKSLSHFYSLPSFNVPSILLTDAQHCQASIRGADSIKVIGAIPLFGVNQTTFCDSGTVVFTNYTIQNDPIVTRTWDFGDNSTSTDLHPVHQFTQPGTYEVIQSVTTQSGCAKSITDTILVYRTPYTRILGDSIVCINELLPLQGELIVPDTAINWAWNSGNGITSPNTNITITYGAAGNYTVSLITGNLLGCKDTTTKSIFVPPTPVITLTHEPTIVVGTGATLPVSYSENIATYNWTPAANLSCTDCPTPFANPKLTTNYNIRVTDIYGCEASRDITVTVICNGQNYFLPNTFSPNGDGINDVFAPRGNGLARISTLKIFNRWGEQVFERRNFLANDRTSTGGWDGTYKGRPASPDVYVYIIEFICENAAIIPVKGNVTLIR